jgi:hypothetical protein
MPIPGENYVLRLKETRGPLVRMTVLDTCVIGLTDTATLLEWSYGSDAGLTLVRMDAAGTVVWSRSQTLCNSAGGDCGKFRIDRGALARAQDGVIVAGSAMFIGGTKPTNFAMRFRDDGAVLWVKRYESIPTPPEELLPDFIDTITPMNDPERWMIASNTESDAHVFHIDGAGNVVQGERWPNTRVRRLRLTPTQILAVGETGILSNMQAFVQGLDRSSGAVVWRRGYWDRTPAPLVGWRWYDVAEGNTSLLAIGQHRNYVDETRPLMAFLDKKNGDLLAVMQPALGDTRVRLRAVVSRQDVIVPLAPAPAMALFAVVGESGPDPWSFLIGEDQLVQWQKRLRLPAGTTGRFNAVVWPSYENIVGAGTTTGITRGFAASSAYSTTRGTQRCSEETKLAFNKPFLEEQRVGVSVEKMRVDASPLATNQGVALEMTFKCLDAQ